MVQVLGWAQAMPMYAGEILELVQTLLDRTLERCRAAYTEVIVFQKNVIDDVFGVSL
jgi:exocyst complex component 4